MLSDGKGQRGPFNRALTVVYYLTIIDLLLSVSGRASQLGGHLPLGGKIFLLLGMSGAIPNRNDFIRKRLQKGLLQNK